MKNTKKRVEAEKLLKKLGKRFRTNAENVVLYEQLNELEYRWTSELGRWETFDEWFERKPPKENYGRIRIIAEPENLDEIVHAVQTGVEDCDYIIVEKSQPYASGNHPKYKGQTALRVYMKAVKYNGAN